MTMKELSEKLNKIEKDFKKLTNEYEEEIIKLQNKIDKAIEFIKEHFDSDYFRWGEWNNKEIKELVSILEGEDNE